MTRLPALPIAILAAVLLSGCAYFGGGESNIEPMAELMEFSPTAKVSEVWTSEAAGGREYLTLVPHAEDQSIYVTGRDGQVSAFAAETGKQRWQVDLEKPVSGGVGGDATLLLLGTKKAEVLALRPKDGTEAWHATLSSEVLAPPVVAADSVVAQTGDGKLFGLSPQDGKRLWSQERSEPSLSLYGTSMPVIVDDLVVAGFANGHLVAFGLKDGQARWDVVVAEPHGRNEIERLVDVDMQPLVSGRVVFTGAYQGRLLALSLDSGGIIWSRELSAYAGMDQDRSNVYVTDASGNVLAIDAATGANVWKQDKLHGRGVTAPAVIGKFVVVGDREGYLHVLRRDDGAFAAREQFSDSAIHARPLVVGETLYVLDVAGKLGARRVH